MDLISRQEVIKLVTGNFFTSLSAQERWDAIRDLPSAQSEHKKGKWIQHTLGHENETWGVDCSACNKWFIISEDTADQYNYCPNCGADMRGGHNDVLSREKKTSQGM